MADWLLILISVSVALLSFSGAAWSLRHHPDNAAAIVRRYRRLLGAVTQLRARVSALSHQERTVLGGLTIFMAVLSTALLVRAVFILAAAAHTEQGIILGALALLLLLGATAVSGINSFRSRTRRHP